MMVRWCPCCFLHRPTVHSCPPPALQVAVVKDGAGVVIPADTATAVRPVPRLIAVDEGALVFVLLPPSPNCPYCPTPSTSGRRCQGWRRCGNFQQTPQRPFGPCRGRWLWMKVRWCPCCFLHRPTVRSCPAPNTSGRRCQGWRRCGNSSRHRNGRSARAEVDGGG